MRRLVIHARREIFVTHIPTDAQAAYDRMGTAYDALSEEFHQRVAYPRLLALLERELGTIQDRSVLDVGCGSGRLVRLLKNKSARAYGIDISDAMTSRGRASGLSLVTGDMRTLPYEDRRFDAVVSYHSFNYIPFKEQAAAIEEQCRVLKVGGTLLLSLFYMSDQMLTPHVVESEGERFVLYLRTVDEMRKLLQPCHCITHETPIATPEETLLVPKTSRALVIGRPYALFIVAHRSI